ncbi:hypothetical protein [Nocardioides immobilis]|uniref:hypothetical protein n=1 Tax=Nocardioides immobilis TaxID=2049295 RepID=UPI0015F92E51|nr:hypothetical protein [Nocardioides immobilis]
MQLRDDLGVTGPLDRTLGLEQPVPGPHPPRHPPVAVAGGKGTKRSLLSDTGGIPLGCVVTHARISVPVGAQREGLNVKSHGVPGETRRGQ